MKKLWPIPRTLLGVRPTKPPYKAKVAPLPARGRPPREVGQSAPFQQLPSPILGASSAYPSQPLGEGAEGRSRRHRAREERAMGEGRNSGTRSGVCLTGYGPC